MKATLIETYAMKESIPPKLRLYVEVENESPSIVQVYAWRGEVSLQQPRLDLGSLETEFRQEKLQPHQKMQRYFFWEVDPRKLERIEEERKGGNLLLDVRLNLLEVSLPPSAPFTPDSLRGEVIPVWSPGYEKVMIPKSTWEEKLEGLGYGKVEYLELYLPPPPMGTQLDESLNHLKKARENFHSGEYPDVLTACRKAIDELQELFPKGAEERETFIAQMLQDKKKAKNFNDLLEIVQKAKLFASGGPHIFWVRAADRRDAEFALRITWAIIGYFAKNLARAKAES